MTRAKLLFAGLFACSLGAVAEEAAPLTTGIGVQYRDVRVSGTASPYKGEGLTGLLSFSRKVIDDDTYAAVNLSYSRDKSRSGDHGVHGEIEGGSASASLMRYVGSGRVVRASLSYGRSALDNITRGVSYDADADSLALGLGVSQYFLLSDQLSGSIGLGYAASRSRRDAYVDNAGVAVRGGRFYQGAFSLSTGLNWRLGAWSPSVGLSWNRGTRAISLAEKDRSSFAYSLGLGYALKKDVSIGVSYSGTAGLDKVRDRSLGLNVSFPL